ncbi:MAG: pyruvate formate lyase family protein, partial [Coriobacteriales bacterium]
VNPYIPEIYQKMALNGVVNFTAKDICPQPIGHFAPNYNIALRKGFKAIKEEAEAKMYELENNGMPMDGAEQYNFYRGEVLVCEGIITFAKRYSEKLAEMAAECEDPTRKAELAKMSEVMGWIIENPARDFRDAVQALWFTQVCVLMDANMHGTSVGRVDQILGDYCEKDLAEGKITLEEAQELIDLYYLKIAECNKVWGARQSKSSPGYTSGQMITVGGIDKDGNDATNHVTYLCLEAMGRLKLHSPVQSLRVHPGTPHKLWECAIAVNKINGGVPTFESDEQIIPALKSRGIKDEDVWNYCIIGCVEPSMGGMEWPACGGLGISSYTNFLNIFLLSINDGKMLRTEGPLVDNETQFGPHTGYLYDMKSIDEVKDAFATMLEYWVQWYGQIVNVFETVAKREMPQPLVSAIMTGCMEKGKDVMWGGAKYNSTGMSGIGLGNVTDSLEAIDYMCFQTKKCTTRELYDALAADWKGYEVLHDTIIKDCPHYGNGLPEVDKYCKFVSDTYADLVVKQSGPRGNHYAAGNYPVTMNVVFGKFTGASPDGRYSGTPLSDGISGVQGRDTSGPTAILNSVTCFDHKKYSNGILLNMKFTPAPLKTDEGVDKLIKLMETYFFDLGGMEMQNNIVSADTLRDAQKHPENYRDLVVRIAGFSAYFVEVYEDSQNDLISRTELNL